MPQRERPLDDAVSMPAWFGVELRNWRKTRELTTLALGKKVQLSASSVERIEKAQRSCNARLADAFDEALDAGGAIRRLWRRVEEAAADADKAAEPSEGDGITPMAQGRISTDRTPSMELSVERRAFLAAGGVAALLPTSLAELAPRLGASELPTSVRPEDIHHIRAAARNHTSWDNRFGGGGIARATSLGQLAWARGMLSVTCPLRLESDLLTAIGELALVVGASAFDACEHTDAAQLLDFATHCAVKADNWHLRARALSLRSRQATWCQLPDDGLTYAESGLVRADRLTPKERAMLHIARARALAKLGTRQATLAAIGHADDAFAKAKEGEDAPWMAHYDYAQHHGDTGHAAFDIAILPGQSSSFAIERLTTAIHHHTDEYVRSRALSATKLATLTMATGDPQEAVAIAHHALDEIGQLRSKRASADVQDLQRVSARYALRPDVAELRERIRTNVLG
ncbi:helix-turn-helix domain-containing protein [Streptomyces millisiae]|uniref:Helix-turn-helix transcriptional regulator n=1 Tax=Streptomyces millisiae TaxID=3075542 RepID=A0ABU2LXY3_9ACTN|nr:helix-turn-helix transcriptional regulator [Streptomyces sp. DSM 44918]MDT0321898.1 helix-turn-helix transcriptional regulator [Streptomyces sp. DSM 44918]